MYGLVQGDNDFGWVPGSSHGFDKECASKRSPVLGYAQQSGALPTHGPGFLLGQCLDQWPSGMAFAPPS